MTTPGESLMTNLLYLNRENRWADFRWHGLELGDDGTMRLAYLPTLQGDLPAPIPSLPIPSGPVGVAVGPDGSIYFSDPLGHRLLKIDACDGSVAQVPCLGGEGDQPTQFRHPRGLLFHPIRRALFVADSGNHRIQIFDLNTFQLIGIWGQEGANPGQFNTPWSLAGDAEGNVYVIDYGDRDPWPRVQKFDALGNVISSFWESVRQARVLTEPSDIAVSNTGDTTRVYIVDAPLHAIFVFGADGHPLMDTYGNPSSFGSDHLTKPMGIVATSDAVYVGDNARNRVLRFKRDGTFVGEAIGYQGPVAGLAVDSRGGLWVHVGSDVPPVRLALRGGYVKEGFLVGGPFRNSSSRSEQWHRLKAIMAPFPPDAHFQPFLFTSGDATPPDGIPRADSAAVDPPWKDHAIDLRTFIEKHRLQGAPLRIWCSIELDSPECLIPGDPLDYVWVGAEFTGGGRASAILSQMRLDFDYQTYLQYLPAIYQESPQSRQFLFRLLSLLTTLFGEVEAAIAYLPRLFGPAATPVGYEAWLAGWLGLELSEDWDDEKRRRAIAEAFKMYARRGTTQGLRDSVRFFTGVDVHVDEPISNATWWSLPADEGSPEVQTRMSVLGFTTMLASAEPQGAVVGTTAILDQSHLIRQDHFGAPLFEAVAHQFTVQLYRGSFYSDKKHHEVHAVLDRERPAHTAYHLCVVEPRMRVGFQARVGIDSVVGGPIQPTTLNEMPVGGGPLILAGEPAGSIGKQSRIGRTTRLGEGTAAAP